MQYDILVLGATGFTGKYIAEYLNTHPQRSDPAQFTFAIAGRSQTKLEAVKKDAKLSDDVGLLVVDVGDYDSVEAAVTRTKVVVNTVGPYWTYADPVVRACAHNGVHYVDLCAEPHFIKAIIEKYDYQAHKKNAILIPSCGFDSVPADVAVYLANKTAKSVLGPSTCIEDSISMYQLTGGFSGGTLASAITSIEDVPKPVMTDAMKDYSYREPKGAPTKPSKLLYSVPDRGDTMYGVPFFMGPMNRLAVHHTWSLFKRSRDRCPDKVYGDNFTYDEIMATPIYLKAVIFLLGLSTFMASILFPPTRWVLKRILPPGTGPGPEGFFEVTNISTAGSSKIRTVIGADGEPGYFGTARMISEAGLALALDFNKLPYKQVGGAGVLTPMTALGEVYIERLKRYYGLKVESEVVSGEESRKRR